MKFVTSLTIDPADMSWLLKLWQEKGEKGEGRSLLTQTTDESENELNPFAHILVSPLFASRRIIETIRDLKLRRNSEVYFDSGGYYVQQGKIGYEELYQKLMDFYLENQWADWYILPDHVPTSQDSPHDVERKVRDTITTSKLFYEQLPVSLRKKAMPVVQGHTIAQVQRCVESYVQMGATYIGFGSFGTNNINSNTNVVNASSLERVKRISRILKDKSIPIHLFGVATPPLIFLFHKLGIYSFDSLSWMRSAGYGKAFLPYVRAYNVSHRSTRNSSLTELEFEKLKSLTGHDCSFCSSFRELSLRKDYRALHNLAVIVDTVEKLSSDFDEMKILEIMKDKSIKYYNLFFEVLNNE